MSIEFDDHIQHRPAIHASHQSCGTPPAGHKRKQKPKSSVRVSQFVSLSVKGKKLSYLVHINRKGFKREKLFSTQKEAEQYRDEQVKQMPSRVIFRRGPATPKS